MLTKRHPFNQKLVQNFVVQTRRVSKVKGTYNIVMVRHGESEWNQKNLFCGWYDAKLTAKGRAEAKRAGEALKAENFKFDLAFTSVLTRARETLRILLRVLDLSEIKIVKNWRLNERHYGGLTGLNKAETAEKYGEEQVALWRRSYDVPPPPMEKDHPYYKKIVNFRGFKDGPPVGRFPRFESLKMTAERTLPFWNKEIVPEIKSGKSIIIVAHGNSLRGVVKYLDQISDAQVMTLNLPTGIPFLYGLDAKLKPVPKGSLQFLGDAETVKMAIESVVAQGKAKK